MITQLTFGLLAGLLHVPQHLALGFRCERRGFLAPQAALLLAGQVLLEILGRLMRPIEARIRFS